VSYFLAASRRCHASSVAGVTGKTSAQRRRGMNRVSTANQALCVPITSSTSCHQAIFVDQAADPGLSSDAVQVEIDRLG
jgi:hypothetical protein